MYIYSSQQICDNGLYKQGYWGEEIWSILPKITQLVKDTGTVCIQESVLDYVSGCLGIYINFQNSIYYFKN